MLALALVAAIVTGDRVALRAAPDRDQAQAAILYKGDWVEVRGQRRGWLEVYDHRHDRPGWLAAQHARVVDVDEPAAPKLRAVVDFLRDTPGAESLGIAYAALYMKVAPKLDASIFVALGTFAQHLAERTDPAAADQRDVAQSWGLRFTASGSRICYDGAVFAQALALAPSPADRATAVLGLTEPTCAPTPAHAALLDDVDPTRLAGPLGNRVRIRRAILSARLAWRADPALAAERAAAAASALARVDRNQLADDDQLDHDAAGLEVAAVRWAAEPVPAKSALVLEPGEPGETCLVVPDSPRRCTHGRVWPASFRTRGDVSVLSVEPLPGWLELWVFRPGAVDILAPVTDSPDLGYVDVVDWNATRAIIARASRVDGAVKRSYDIVRLATLAVEKQTATLASARDQLRRGR